MTRTLEERLAALAEHEVTPSSVPADELWGRGRRWQRRRAVVTSLAVSCAVALLGGTVVWGTGGSMPGAAEISVAGSPGEPATVPDEVWEPSPWLDTLVDGPVVAIQETERGSWWGSELAVAAIAAHGGEYGFLDLPGYVEGASLSTDGRRVAYWVSGTPSGEPQTAEGQASVVTGVAVTDLVTGEEWRHDFDTQHGLAPEGLVWLDADTVASGHSHWVAGDSGSEMDQSSANRRTTWLWDLASPLPVAWEPGVDVDLDRAVVATRPGEVLLAVDDALWWSAPSAKVGVKRLQGRYRWSSHSGTPLLAWAPEGRLASVGGGSPDKMPNKVQVTEVTGPESRLAWRTVPKSRETFGVLGWREGEIIVHSRIRDESYRTALFTMDPDDGTMTPLVLPAGSGTEWTLGLLSSGWQWAGTLLETGEVVAGEKPPSPPDPRAVVGLVAGGVVTLLIGVVVWRRRGHP